MSISDTWKVSATFYAKLGKIYVFILQPFFTKSSFKKH